MASSPWLKPQRETRLTTAVKTAWLAAGSFLSAVLAALKRRRLDPNAVRMVVSDGSTGLSAALAKELPAAQQQGCVEHKVRCCRAWAHA